MNSKLSDTIQTLYQINTDTSKKTKDKNMSLFKKYLNPWNKTNLISPTKIKGMKIFVWLLCSTDFMLKLLNVQISIIPFQLQYILFCKSLIMNKFYTDTSLQLQQIEKKKRQKIFKKKKTINYTTIRKQIPSFEHSVESSSSGVKVLKYPKVSQKQHNIIKQWINNDAK